jgi:hypothetical protein
MASVDAHHFAERSINVAKNVWEKKTFGPAQGCQIFLGTTYQNGKNVPNNQQIGIPNGHICNIPNVLKIYQMSVK